MTKLQKLRWNTREAWFGTKPSIWGQWHLTDWVFEVEITLELYEGIEFFFHLGLGPAGFSFRWPIAYFGAVLDKPGMFVFENPPTGLICEHCGATVELVEINGEDRRYWHVADRQALGVAVSAEIARENLIHYRYCFPDIRRSEEATPVMESN